jgi:hypothetical protein
MHRLPDHRYVSSSSSSSSYSYSSSSSDDDDEYNPVTNGDNTNQLAPDPLLCRPPPSSAHRVLPVVGAFAVQCHSCSKWRLIPTKKKYEEIREHNLQHPFVCEKAREWQCNISCDDPEDVSQDDSMIWAIDKPGIPQTPDGWQRLLQIRGEGSSQFGDMYVSIFCHSFYQNLCINTTIMNFGQESLPL